MATSTKKDHLIRFRCECGKKLKADPEIIGRKVQCTECPRIHRVPESDQLGTKPVKTPKLDSNPVPSAQTNSSKRASATASKTASRKKKKRAKSPTDLGQPSAAQSDPQSITAQEQPSLFINDELAAKEPSLLPSKNDSSSRFKLNPKFDPEPSEQLPSPDDRFDFDLADLEVNTDVLPKRDDRSQKTGTKSSTTVDRNNADSKAATIGSRLRYLQGSINKTTVIAGAAAALGSIFFATLGLYLFSDASLPAEFSERPEVKNYVTKINEFRKSQRELEIVSEAYVKSKSPPPQEREQIEAFNRSIQPLANKEEKLNEALELFQASQADRARTALITATEALDQKIPELQAKAKDFASKLR